MQLVRDVTGAQFTDAFTEALKPRLGCAQRLIGASMTLLAALIGVEEDGKGVCLRGRCRCCWVLP